MTNYNMGLEYPEESLLRNNKLIIDEVLKDEKVQIIISDFVLAEDFDDNISNVRFNLTSFHKKEKTIKNIEGYGNGVVDALLSSILNYFSDDYVSLQNVKLYDFIVEVDFTKGRNSLNSDAPVEIKIVLESNSRSKLYFKARSNSIVRAGISAVCKTIEYLVNAENAVLRLHKDILHAKERRRTDLEDTYIRQLLELVKFISYSRVIENLKTTH